MVALMARWMVASLRCRRRSSSSDWAALIRRFALGGADVFL
jgi:hypothetical protein